jgi:prepilin peptidase CpaA
MNLLADAPDWLRWILFTLLVAAAAQDAAQLKISNVITFAVLLLGLAAIALQGIEIGVWQNLATFAAVLGVGTLLFSRGFLGGADVKLFAAVALWTDFHGALWLVAAILLCGGVLAIAVLLLRLISPARASARVKMLQPKSGIPYGVAISAGTIIVSLFRAA